jgi:hypothetical protein
MVSTRGLVLQPLAVFGVRIAKLFGKHLSVQQQASRVLDRVTCAMRC